MGQLITMISAIIIFLFDATPALTCADGVSCAVVRSTPDGFVRSTGPPKRLIKINL